MRMGSLAILASEHVGRLSIESACRYTSIDFSDDGANNLHARASEVWITKFHLYNGTCVPPVHYLLVPFFLEDISMDLMAWKAYRFPRDSDCIFE